MAPDPPLPWWVSPAGGDPDSNPGWSVPQSLLSPLAWSPPQGSQSLLSPLAALSPGFLTGDSFGAAPTTPNPFAIDSAPFSAAPLAAIGSSPNLSNAAPSFAPSSSSSWSWANSPGLQFPAGPLWPTLPSDAAPFAQLPGWPSANAPTPDAFNVGLGGSSTDLVAATAPAPSGLLSTPPGAPGGDLLDHYLANLDQVVRRFNAFDLPLSKSGVPYFPPPLPSTHDQALVAARLLAPNIVDYFTDQTPPALTPNAVGKFPTKYYGTGAVIDLATLLLSALSGGGAGAAVRSAGAAERELAQVAGQAVRATARPNVTPSVIERLQAQLDAASVLAPGFDGAMLTALGRAAPDTIERSVPEAVSQSAKITGRAVSSPLAAAILDHAALLRANAELGRIGEEAVGIPANAPKPSITVFESGATRYPDRLTPETIEEVKNVKYLAFTQQLRDYFAHAQRNNLIFVLHARPDTTYSSPLLQLIDAGQIQVRYIPGR